MKYFIFSLNLLFIIIITAAISFSRKDMLRRARPIIIILSIEFITTLVLMHTSAGENSLNYIESRIEHLIHYANQGINFVFGEITNKSSPAFIVVALLPLVFICSLIGLLKHFKILNIFIIIIGSSINRISKLGKLESFAAVNTIAVGMTAVYVSIKEYIPRLTQPQMYTIAACSLSTVDLAILGAVKSNFFFSLAKTMKGKEILITSSKCRMAQHVNILLHILYRITSKAILKQC